MHVARPQIADRPSDWLNTRLASTRSLRPTACAISETVPTPSTCNTPLSKNPRLPAAATPAMAASPSPATKYRSTSWQIMIVTMPATIGGAMFRMWLTMEPCVRSFISNPSPTRGLGTSERRAQCHLLRRGNAAELRRLPFEQPAIDAARARRQHGVGALLDD